MPGSIGGDLVKAFYVCKERPNVDRTTAILSIILDRVLGLYALVCLGILGFLFNARIIMQDMTLSISATLIASVFLTMSAFFFLIITENSWFSQVRLWLFQISKIKVFKQVTKALQYFQGRAHQLFIPFSFSFLFQLMYALYCYLITITLFEITFDPYLMLSIVPFAVIIASLPVSPAGIGVGHLAFDQFYEMLGLSGGSNVFNIVLISQLLPNLLGVFPYIFSGKADEIPETVEGNEF